MISCFSKQFYPFRIDSNINALRRTVHRQSFPVVTRLSLEPRLKDRVCVISGASRGFGRAIAIRFVEEGAKVVLLDINDCSETISLIGSIEGVNDVRKLALACKCDITNENNIKQSIIEATQQFGQKIHVLINNAALFIFKSVETATAEDWDHSSAVNIKGHALLTKHILPFMKNMGNGSIVFLGSISSFRAQPNCATYATMKGAVVQLARNCAYDLAKYQIRVNSICPGTVDTPISQTEREAHKWTYEHWEKIKTQDMILGRVGNVREIANAALFFASDESSFCTGSHLMVDGGQDACTIMH